MLAPTNFRASSVVGNLVTFRWDPPSGGLTPTHYVIEAGLSPGSAVASVATPGPDPILTVGAPDGIYYVRVYAVSDTIRSVASTEIRLYVQVPVPPSAPADLLAMVNGSAIALSWRNTFAGGTPTAMVIDASGAVTGSLPIPLAERLEFAAVPAGTYTVVVRAANDGGSSTPSNAVTFTVPAPCSGAPQTPSNVLAYRVSNTIIIVWDPPPSGTAVTSYLVSVSGAFNASFPITTRTISGAVGSGAYTFSVRSVNACGSSAPSVPQTVVVP